MHAPDRPAHRAARTASVVAVSATLTAAAALAVAAPALAGADVTRSAGPLVRYSQQVPIGATARVHSVATPEGRTIVTLTVHGLAPNETYGAHAHRDGCTVAGGPHWQRQTLPSGTANGPEWANPANEIWLDLTTDAAGAGSAKAVVDGQFRPAEGPQSVIIHEHHTDTGAADPVRAGTAGAKLACLSAF